MLEGGGRGGRIALTDDEVHVWYADPAGARDRWESESCLGAEELARYREFVKPRDRRLYLAAHTMLRGVLSRYARSSPSEWRFGSSPDGKPRVDAPRGARWVHFNLSHTQGLVACAVRRGAAVGIDVEDRGRPVEVMELARRFFAPAEVARLERAPAAARRVRFLEVWTLKEAYLKARGIGLSGELDDSEFWVDDQGGVRARLPGTEGWRFRHLRPTARHVGAVALRQCGSEPPRIVASWYAAR